MHYLFGIAVDYRCQASGLCVSLGGSAAELGGFGTLHRGAVDAVK